LVEGVALLEAGLSGGELSGEEGHLHRCSGGSGGGFALCSNREESVKEKEGGKERARTVEVSTTCRCSRRRSILLSVRVVAACTSRCRSVSWLRGAEGCRCRCCQNGGERRESGKWRNGRSEKFELSLQAVEVSRQL
jgi:hypothetical protein